MPLSPRPLFALLFAAACHAQAAAPIVLNVDASNVAQQIFQIKASIPAAPGEMTLLYPQWIPGNHGPSGPLNQLAGLRLSANGQNLEWRRDPVNMFAFHVTVPAGDWVRFPGGGPAPGRGVRRLQLALDETAVFARRGARIPLGPDVEHCGGFDGRPPIERWFEA